MISVGDGLSALPPLAITSPETRVIVLTASNDEDDLAALTTARQFPDVVSDVAGLVSQTGPVQSQTARSPFIGLAARAPFDLGAGPFDPGEAFDAGHDLRILCRELAGLVRS